MRAIGQAFTALTAALIVLGSSFAGADAQARSVTYDLDIPPQGLHSALQQFALTSQHRLLYRTELVEGKSSPALKGAFTASEAVGRLLSGTNLTFEITPSAVVLIRAQDDTARTLAAPQAPVDEGRAHDMAAGSDGFRVASAETETENAEKVENSSDTARRNEVPSARDSNESKAALGEVVVTGTHIRGEAPVGSNVIVLDRVEIDKTGYATVQQVVQSLTQSFQGGPNEDTFGIAEGRADLNLDAGSSINLRGLGADSTLTLINGRRTAASGLGGIFVDVSTIPVTAIERVEVVPDGASAIYGSDAVGGVVNIILRTDYEGLDTQARYGRATAGDLDEYQLGQALGTDWDTGNLLLTYEFYKRFPLAATEREFTTQDLRPFGGDDFREPFSNPGNITDFVETFAIPPGQDGRSLAVDDLLPGVINLADQREQTDVLPKQERHSVYLTASQELTDRIEAFGEGLYTERQYEQRFRPQTQTLTVPASNPFFVDPFGGSSDVAVQYSFVDDLGPEAVSGKVRTYSATGGATINIADAWQGEAYASYSRRWNKLLAANLTNQEALDAALADPDPATAFNPFGDGLNTNPATIETIRGFVRRTDTSDVLVFNGNVDGTLFALPGGEVKLAFGAEYREESFETERFDATVSAPQPDPRRFQERDVTAAFAELLIPVVGEGNALPGIARLEVSVAGRLEDFSDFGTTTDPKIGASWSPISGLTLRGTYGTSFKAPRFIDVDPNERIFFDFALEDPMSPTGFTNAAILRGTKDRLDPEEATTWTAGIDLRPEAVPGFEIGVSYFDIEIDARIKDPSGDVLGALIDEELAPLITRNPPLEAVQAIFDDPAFAPFFGLSPEDIEAIVDLRVTNIGVVRTRGLDVTALYGFDTNFGRFDLRAAASVIVDFEEALTETSPRVDVVDTIGNPVDWRMRNSVSWNYGGFSGAVFLNYTDSYTDDESDPSRRIDSWTTVDLHVAYDTGDRPADEWLRGIVFALSCQNLFDEDPPFANNRAQFGVGFDPQNADALGRFIAFQINKKW